MASAADPKLKLIWLALIACASVSLSLGVLFLGPGVPFGLLLLPVIAFSAVAFAVRWIVFRDAPRNALGRKLLLVVGGAKVAAFLALILLILECVLVAVVRPDARGAMLGTFVTGMVAFAMLNIAITGVVNSLLIVRKLIRR